METKQKGDIAEQAAIVAAMKLGWGVSHPLGDRLPYDLIFDVQGTLVKAQVKSAWLHRPTQNYVVDNRRTKTNRRIMLREAYSPNDFDFALIFLEEINIFYVLPVHDFIKYGSAITIVESVKRQRKPQSAKFRNAWNLISQWAAHEETHVAISAKFGEPSHHGNPEPSSGLPEKV